MQLHVLRELRQSIGAKSEYEVDEPLVRADDVTLEDVHGLLALLRTDRGLLVTLDATGLVQERCSRCLVDVKCEVAIHFEEEYVPVINPVTGATVRLPRGSDLFRIGPDYLLDLREGLRQYILMSGPTKPLCREACAGLCPTCGANLNAGPCGCAPSTDERWSALAGLKSEGSEGS